MMLRAVVAFGEMVTAPLLALFLLCTSTLPGDVMPGLVLGGAVAWTLTEYAFHRWVLHDFAPKAHRAHHAYPLLAVEMFFWPIWLGFGVAYLLAGGVVLAGVLLAYAWYLFVHHCAHHGQAIGFRAPAGLLRHHAGHHKFATQNFGVSVDLWDRTFGTKI